MPDDKAVEHAHVIFPAFDLVNPLNLTAFSYHDRFLASMQTIPLEEYAQSHQGGVPLVLYTEDLGKMAVFSPLDNFKATHMSIVEGMWGSGPKSTSHTIPSGFTQSFILSASGSGSVKEGLMSWGSKVLE
ncbi:hypothetical protein TrRE_jg10020 [Triparma retinervis]|uniref:Uncharacterized protein n=1 Tax=Triparma retinervis TaxID=2557542 RepID=A0A9W7ECB8_9STRA|nr:hypothetical protein TrRE_jg10020 [Triparma retinervis]